LENGAGTVTLGNQTAFGQVRYTLDGSEPTLQAKLDTQPLLLKLGTVIKAAVLSRNGGLLAAARSYEFSADTLLRRSSNQLQPCPGGDLGLRLPLTPDSPAAAPVYDMDVFHSLDEAQDQVKSYPAQTLFSNMTTRREFLAGTAELG
jgi:hexosaminidase